MPKEKPIFHLRIEGKESWSFAEIDPNWTFNTDNKPAVNPWNENARKVMEKNTIAKHEHDFNERGVCSGCSLSEGAVLHFSRLRIIQGSILPADPSWLKCKGNKK